MPLAKFLDSFVQITGLQLGISPGWEVLSSHILLVQTPTFFQCFYTRVAMSISTSAFAAAMPVL